ncbi:hypothetical protein BU15DRAFT_7986, partial [Melanogaster broomeanus]
VNVSEIQLLRDIKTRWDSTFYMINHLCTLWPPVDWFLLMLTQKNITKHKMDNTEWFILKDYEVILNVAHFIQQQMSSESQPVLSCAIPCFELFMTIWEKHARANKHIA